MVGASKPYCLGEFLADFLHSDNVVLGMAVDDRKFAIDADVFHDSYVVSVKIRVYEENEGQFAVEVVRRKGDALVFMEFFRKLARSLQRNPCCHSVSPQKALELPVRTVSPIVPVYEEDWGPLIDMARHAAAMPDEFRAELASAIARALREESAALLSRRHSTCLLRALAGLLRDTRQDVCFPAAEAVCLLARRQTPEETPAILEVIHDTLCAASTGNAMRKLIASAMVEAPPGVEDFAPGSNSRRREGAVEAPT